jgi:hypothetical protein
VLASDCFDCAPTKGNDLQRFSVQVDAPCAFLIFSSNSRERMGGPAKQFSVDRLQD